MNINSKQLEIALSGISKALPEIEAGVFSGFVDESVLEALQEAYDCLETIAGN